MQHLVARCQIEQNGRVREFGFWTRVAIETRIGIDIRGAMIGRRLHCDTAIPLDEKSHRPRSTNRIRPYPRCALGTMLGAVIAGCADHGDDGLRHCTFRHPRRNDMSIYSSVSSGFKVGVCSSSIAHISATVKIYTELHPTYTTHHLTTHNQQPTPNNSNNPTSQTCIADEANPCLTPLTASL